eukprot:gene34439-41682_t
MLLEFGHQLSFTVRTTQERRAGSTSAQVTAAIPRSKRTEARSRRALKDAVIQEKDARLAERDAAYRKEVTRLEAELLRSAGLLSARGVLEALLKKVYDTDSYFTYSNDNKKYNKRKSYTASYVAKFIDDVAKGVSFEGERAELVKDMVVWKKVCKEDSRDTSLQKLNSALSEQIHQFSWSGREVGAKLSGMTEIHMCLIDKMAGHFNLGVAVVSEEVQAEDEEDDNQA